MKKKAPAQKTQNAEDKSLLKQAGEVIGSVGDHIVQAKDSVVDFVADEVVVVKKTARKIARKVKKAVKKTPANKIVKKVAGKKGTTKKKKS
jgi:hypothetical protein